MSNEYLEDIAQAGTEESNMDAAEANAETTKSIEDGPLDPSVFFGLFDDLDKSTDEADELAPADDEVSQIEPDAAPSDPSDSTESSDEPVGDNGTGSDTESDSNTSPDTVETAEAAQPSEQIQSPPTAPSPTPSLFFVPAQPFVPTQPTPTPEPAVSGGQPQQTPHLNAPAATTVSRNGVGTDGGPTNRSRTAMVSPPEVAPPALPFPPERKSPPVTMPVQSERAGGRLATAALLTIAVGLLGGLIVAFVLSLRSPDVAPELDQTASAPEEEVPASSTVVEELSLTNVTGGFGDGTVSTEKLNELVAAETSNRLEESRLDLTGIVFQHGTTALDGPSQDQVAQLGAALVKAGDVPLTATVRTYSERTASENLILSRRQAEALVEALVAAGAAPDQVRAVGIGSGPLSEAQPVPNFVEVTPGFGDGSISASIQAAPPFAIGDSTADGTPSSWPFRLESLIPLTEIGGGLQLDDETSVGLAGYSFMADSDEQNRSTAKAATDRVAQVLATDFGVDLNRISIITLGSAPYVPPAATGNLIWIAAGPESRLAFDVAGVDTDAISFSGSAVSPDSEPSLDALGAVLAATGAEVVIDVRSYDGGDSATNLSLSQGRAETLLAALEAAGVAPGQVRTVASGASSYFPADGPHITVTVVP